MATTASSVKRVTAERVLREFLDRVRTVNESDSYLYRVERVILFGSMLNKEKDRVNDIDLVLELVPKERDLEKAHQLNMAYANEQVAKGRHYRNYADMLFFAKNDALKFLRKRSRLLNFHNPDDSVWADSPHRTIYENG